MAVALLVLQEPEGQLVVVKGVPVEGPLDDLPPPLTRLNELLSYGQLHGAQFDHLTTWNGENGQRDLMRIKHKFIFKVGRVVGMGGMGSYSTCVTVPVRLPLWNGKYDLTREVASREDYIQYHYIRFVLLNGGLCRDWPRIIKGNHCISHPCCQ